MTRDVSNRAVIVLSVLAILLSVLGTMSVMVLTETNQYGTPSDSAGHITVNVIQKLPQQSNAGRISFEVRNPDTVVKN